MWLRLAMADSDTALVVVGLLGLFGVSLVCIAYFASREPRRREPVETVVHVERTARGYVIVEREEPVELRLKQRGVRIVAI